MPRQSHIRAQGTNQTSTTPTSTSSCSTRASARPPTRATAAQDTDTDTARRHVDDTARRIKIPALASSTPPERAAQPLRTIFSDSSLHPPLPPPTASRTPPRPPPRPTALPRRHARSGSTTPGSKARVHDPSARARRARMYPKTHAAAAEPTHAGTRAYRHACARGTGGQQKKDARASDGAYLLSKRTQRSQDTDIAHTHAADTSTSTARMRRPPTDTHAYGWESPHCHAHACDTGGQYEKKMQGAKDTLCPQYWSAAEERGAARRRRAAKDAGAVKDAGDACVPTTGAQQQKKGARGLTARILKATPPAYASPSRDSGPAIPAGSRRRRAGSETKVWHDTGAQGRKVGRRAGLSKVMSARHRRADGERAQSKAWRRAKARKPRNTVPQPRGVKKRGARCQAHDFPSARTATSP
ncbi:hypothetical protein C8J57DRAFT_1563667 [Mycena rebaudengoi]|nr:hypothetical protein C8J57DRAFT_1563667 [Mycena rebaudengoi]